MRNECVHDGNDFSYSTMVTFNSQNNAPSRCTTTYHFYASSIAPKTKNQMQKYVESWEKNVNDNFNIFLC